jgi:hypothetical protein
MYGVHQQQEAQAVRITAEATSAAIANHAAQEAQVIANAKATAVQEAANAQL